MLGQSVWFVKYNNAKEMRRICGAVSAKMGMIDPRFIARPCMSLLIRTNKLRRVSGQALLATDCAAFRPAMRPDVNAQPM